MNPDLPTLILIGAALLFFGGWLMARSEKKDMERENLRLEQERDAWYDRANDYADNYIPYPPHEL